MKTTYEKLKLTTAKLRVMKVGESKIVTERVNTNPGAATTSKANGCGIKVTTQGCWIIVPSTEELIKAVIVTRKG